MNLLVRWIISALAVLVTSYLLPGVHVDTFVAALVVAVVLGIINVSLKPLLVILTLPLKVVTLGLFMLVINALLILLTSRIVEGFKVDGFFWALLFSIVLSVISSFLQSAAKK
jgi:putative membrane protein